jgi:hypothetical protein
LSLQKQPILSRHIFRHGDRCARDRMGVGFITICASSAYPHWCCEFECQSGRGVQQYVKTFVNDRSVVFSGSSGVIHENIWPPRYNWHIVERGFKHHKAKQKLNYLCLLQAGTWIFNVTSYVFFCSILIFWLIWIEFLNITV